jgi:hypothetical protein
VNPVDDAATIVRMPRFLASARAILTAASVLSLPGFSKMVMENLLQPFIKHIIDDCRSKSGFIGGRWNGTFLRRESLNEKRS